MVVGDHERPNARLRQSHKDARLILEQAERLSAPSDHIALVQAALAEGEAGGLGECDNSSAIEIIRRRAGIGRLDHETGA